MKLNVWKKNLNKMLEDSYTDRTLDTDHPKCPNCGTKMNFYGHDENGDYPLGEGYWKCGDCGLSVTENDLKK